MKYTKHLSAFGIAGAVLVSASNVSAQLFSDDFDSGTSGANWTVNKSGNPTGNNANFTFDYSSLGIPSAPNSLGGSTVGLRLEANTTGGIFSGLSVSPTGQSFLGDYRLRFDMWENFNGPLPVGGSGSTQAGGGGIGTAGTTAQWAGGAQDSIHFSTTTDGNSSVDVRAYSSAAGSGYAADSGVFAAGTQAGSRNAADPYYAQFGGNSAPAAQGISGTTGAGTMGFAWRDVVIEKVGNNVTWSIDGLLLANVDASTVTLGGNNILLNMYDTSASSTTDNPNTYIFTLFDNVRVEAVPEPSMLAFGLMGAVGALWAIRRRK